MKIPCSIAFALSLVGTLFISGSARAEFIARMNYAGTGANALVSCVLLQGIADSIMQPKLATPAVVRVLAPGETLFEVRSQIDAVPGSRSERNVRYRNPIARIAGGISSVDLRQHGDRLRLRVEACGLFNDTPQTLMALEVAFGSGEEENFYTKGEWKRRHGGGPFEPWYLSRRAAARE